MSRSRDASGTLLSNLYYLQKYLTLKYLFLRLKIGKFCTNLDINLELLYSVFLSQPISLISAYCVLVPKKTCLNVFFFFLILVKDFLQFLIDWDPWHTLLGKGAVV